MTNFRTCHRSRARCLALAFTVALLASACTQDSKDTETTRQPATDASSDVVVVADEHAELRVIAYETTLAMMDLGDASYITFSDPEDTPCVTMWMQRYRVLRRLAVLYQQALGQESAFEAQFDAELESFRQAFATAAIELTDDRATIVATNVDPLSNSPRPLPITLMRVADAWRVDGDATFPGFLNRDEQARFIFNATTIRLERVALDTEALDEIDPDRVQRQIRRTVGSNPPVWIEFPEGGTNE
ncbi:MAG: hypothetical protein AAF432_00085 [Planctomycetota bacterium]